MTAPNRLAIYVASALAFAGSFTIFFLLMDLRLNIFDEAIILVSAVRVLNGEVPHRDFYSLYGPGSYYILAGLFRTSPHWFIISRIYGVASMAGIVATCLLLLVRHVRLGVALGFSAIVGAWMLAYPYYLYPLFPCLLLALIASALLLYFDEKPQTPLIVWAGFATGLATLFRYDTGFFIVLAHCIAMSGFGLVRSAKGPSRPYLFIRLVALYGIGVCIAFGPCVALYLTVAPPSAFYDDIVDYPLHYYRAMRGLPFPGIHKLVHRPDELGVYIPIVAVALAGAYNFLRPAQRWTGAPVERTRSSFVFIVMFLTLSAVLFYKGVVRVGSLHMMMSIVPATLLFAVLVDRLWEAHPSRRALAAIIVMVACLPPLYGAARQVHDAWRGGRTPLSALVASANVRARAQSDSASKACGSTPRMLFSDEDPEDRYVESFIRKNVSPSDKVLVGLSRHDKVFVNPISVYFAAERLPATHWHEFEPGIQTRADVQNRMIFELTVGQVRWIVRDGRFEAEAEPNQSRFSSGVHLLDRFIDAHYRPVASSGKLQVWLRKDVVAPFVAAPGSSGVC